MLNANRKKIVVIIIAMALTVALSFSALSYSWFIRQVVLERSHVFPATGFEILQFESEVSQSAQEGKLYPATLKRSYFQDGFDLDYYNYDVVPRNGILPPYVEKAAGQVTFKVDLSYWSGLDSIEGSYQVIKLDQTIKIKNAEEEGKSTRDLSKTGEMTVGIEFKEHDKSIFISDSEPVLRRGQFLRDGSVIIADDLGRNHHYKMFSDSDHLIFNENDKILNFGDYNKSFYSTIANNEFEVTLNTASATPYYNVATGIDLMKYRTNFMFYRDNSNNKSYFASPDCLETQTFDSNIMLKSFKSVKENYYVTHVENCFKYVNDNYNYEKEEYYYYKARDVFIPSSQDVNIYKHDLTNELILFKNGEEPPTLIPNPSGPIPQSILNPFYSYYGNDGWKKLTSPNYGGYVNQVAGGLHVKNDLILTQNNVLYDRGKTIVVDGEDVSLLTHEFFDKSTSDVLSEQLNYCFIVDDAQDYCFPEYNLLPNTFFVKNSTIGYFRNNQLLHSSVNKYSPVIGDRLLFLHKQTGEISPGDAGFDSNGGLIPDPLRAVTSNIVVDLDHVVYKKDEIQTRFIDKVEDFSEAPTNIVIFIDGDFLSYDTDITSLQTYKGRYLLTKAYILTNNIVVLRNNLLRLFTSYTPADGDVVLYQDGHITEAPQATDYIKTDTGGDYVENIFLFPGDYAYKDLNTYKDHVINSPDLINEPEEKKPIVFNCKLVMGRDSTFLLNIGMYIAVFDEDFDPGLKEETFVLNLSATFESI